MKGTPEVLGATEEEGTGDGQGDRGDIDKCAPFGAETSNLVNSSG
jgi:hypothetical protein